MTLRTTARWVLLALAGLLIAVAVAVLASKLTSQRIGLASEPLQAAKALAPPERRSPDKPPAHAPSRHGHAGTSTATTVPTTTTTLPPVATTTVPPPTSVPPAGDDSGSGGENRPSGDD